MSEAFICDICQKYYKDNDHSIVKGATSDHRGRERTLQLNVFKSKEVGYRNYYDEIEHFCRDCLLRLLASAYPELKLNPLVGAGKDEKNN